MRNNIIKCLMYLLSLLLVLDGNSMYHALANFNFHFPVLCLGIIVLIFIAYGKFSVERRNFCIAFSLLVYFFVYFVIKIDTVDKSTYSAIMIGVPLMLFLFEKLQESGTSDVLFFYIENVILILAVISLFFWLFGEVLNVINTNMSMTVTWGQLRTYEGFFGLQFVTTISNSIGKGLYGNSGIFTEGPMFCFWLCIALSTELFLKEELSKIKVMLLVGTIFTTLSTTGIFFVAFFIGLRYCLHMKGRSSLGKTVMVFVLIMALPVVIVGLQQVYYLKMGTSSFLIRMQDYAAGYTLWKQNPIFGSGYGDISALQKYVLASRAGNVGFSNSFSAILGTGGLWNFIIYILSIILPLGTCNSVNPRRKCFFVCYAFLSVFLIFFARFIMAVFIAFSFSQISHCRATNNTEEQAGLNY